MVGDEVRNTFTDLSEEQSVPTWITLLYLFTFCLFFMTVFLQVFIALVEDAFITQGMWMLDVKRKRRLTRGASVNELENGGHADDESADYESAAKEQPKARVRTPRALRSVLRYCGSC